MNLFGYSIYKTYKPKGKYRLLTDLSELLVENRIIVNKKWEKVFKMILDITDQSYKYRK